MLPTHPVPPPWLQLLSGAIKMSFVPLLIAVFLTLVGILFFGSLVYFLERGEWNDTHRLYFTNAVTVRCAGVSGGPPPPHVLRLYSFLSASM